MIIKTKEDWWKLLDSSWEGILENMSYEFNFNLGKTATDDLMPNGKPLGKSCLEDLEQAKESRNHYRILRYLNAFWEAAPDAGWIHSIPYWGDLCDLCSESWVFSEGEEK